MQQKSTSTDSGKKLYMMPVAFHQKLPSNETDGFHVAKTIKAFPCFKRKRKEQLMLQIKEKGQKN